MATSDNKMVIFGWIISIILALVVSSSNSSQMVNDKFSEIKAENAAQNIRLNGHDKFNESFDRNLKDIQDNTNIIDKNIVKLMTIQGIEPIKK